jgi:hypothetical protein
MWDACGNQKLELVSKSVYQKNKRGNVVVEPEVMGRQYLEDFDWNFTIEATGEREKEMEKTAEVSFSGNSVVSSAGKMLCSTLARSLTE